MSHYLSRLIAYAQLLLVALVVTPILPLFARDEYGPINNRNAYATEPRLPSWLFWFMTPDNSLYGDNKWKLTRRFAGYWSQVAWLYRNKLYGFAWSVLSAPVNPGQLWFSGDLTIGRSKPGALYVSMGDYWQYKSVRKLPFGYALMLNFGWLLDAYCASPGLWKTQPNALFLFSPRIVRMR